ncbi:hypothetical protein BKA00_006913 [Actinomadura coerulea]|uniref:DUF2975 domain-containing protein n=1 Tax=Actinomadura coerulea TaxID=46159 RepID=A0A7X0G5U7_9ACTN|nr:DUF2975 domain-containing protein [Actinomadura coerulea]MBB6399999.1 hypothetical protein [Actinomadura coerulea]GGQ17509.1 hypothetical protein GCM10010187_37350 [Actinomadura coerulea]
MTLAACWTKFDSRFLELVIGIGLLLVGLFQALFPILGVTGPFPPIDTRDVDLRSTAQVPHLASGGTVLRGTHHAELAVGDPGLGDRVLLAAPEVLRAVLIIVILSVLLRMAATFRTGDVFVPANVRRLFAVSTAVLLLGVAAPAFDMLTTNALVSGTALEDAVEIGFTVRASTVLLAVLIAALAGAFGHGARLRADTEGLV